MALERKDVRAKLDPDLHAALQVLADIDKLDLGEWVERLLVREICGRVHDANVIHERTARLGISGNGRESPGNHPNGGQR